MNIPSTETDITQEDVEWVGKLAYRLSEYQHYVEFDDLMQVGLIQLIKTVPKHDPEKGSSRQTFCTVPVRGAMLNEITRCTPGSRQKGDYSECCIDDFEDELVDLETPELISELEADSKLRQKILADLPALLDDREACVLQMFLNGMDTSEVGNHFGFSPRRAAQILAGIESKVKTFVAGYYQLKVD